MDFAKVLAKELSLDEKHVQNVLNLLEDGNTIPFIARYRKEMTGSMDDTVLRKFHERHTYLQGLEERREGILRLIKEQEKLTPELAEKIQEAQTLQELEDLYRPYKQKRKTRAFIAAEKGLKPLADFILLQTGVRVESEAEKYINEEKGVASLEEALGGASDIIAEFISDNAEYRAFARRIFLSQGMIVTKAKTEENTVYDMYADFSEPVRKIAPHRILAVNRGEKEGVLSVSVDEPSETVTGHIANDIIKRDSPSAELIRAAISDAYSRLIRPSVQNEVRGMLTEKSEEHAIGIFSENLKNLLMQPPLRETVVLGLDPAYRTGCKTAVVDEASRVVATTVIYPTPPQSKIEEAKKIIKDLIYKYNVSVIAIGNGTASKETEIFVSELLSEIDREVFYMVVSEAGASVYSASELAAKEFPQYDVSLRSAVSIARRLIDPLSELVKIEPKAIGVGQYQHDMNPKRLDESLGGVVENCVNRVGVNLNTASAPLLSYISGVNKTVSENIVAYREENGGFKSRAELKKVKKLGEKTFVQCAGFLRITDPKNILDNTGVHPESYKAAEAVLKHFGYTDDDVRGGRVSDIENKILQYGRDKLANELGIGTITLSDIAAELKKPGRDVRDSLPKPELRRELLDIKNLKEGMEITGTVRNVTDFGAFVDIGVHRDGLVHISELRDGFVKHPTDVVKVGDIVKVRVLDVDTQKNRISLSMK